jgi:hypothetical protein
MKTNKTFLLVFSAVFISGIVAGNYFVAFPAQSQYSDLLISHYPNLVFLKRTLFASGEFPLWSNQILSGYPFYANPLSGLWYLPNWLAALIPFPLSFNLLFVLHLIFGGAGVYRFLRRQKVETGAAVVAAFSFAIFPKTIAHFAAGHVSLVNAVYWTPFLLIATEDSFNHQSLVKWKKVLPGIVLGMIALADIRWVAFAAFVYFLFSAYCCYFAENKESFFKATKMWVATGLLQLVVLLGVSAPVWLPLLQYSALSTRSLMTMDDRLMLSIEPLRLLGIIFPDFAGYAEWILYPGAILICSIPILPYFKRNRDIQFWAFVGLFSLLFALGKHFVLAPVFYLIPGADLLRIPSRMVFVFGLCSALLVGYTINGIAILKPSLRPGTRMLFFVLAVFASSVCVGLFVIGGILNLEMVWGTAGIFVALTAFVFFLDKKIHKKCFHKILLGLVVLNIGLTSLTQIRWEGLVETVPDTANMINCFEGISPFRIYSPSYSIPQEIAAISALELVDGVDPLQLIGYAKFMEKASGVPITGYSVTIPSFATGDVETDNQRYHPNLSRLGLLNTRYIVSAFEISELRDFQINCRNQLFVYRNPYEKPRAWVETDLGEVDVDIISLKANSIIVNTQGPGKLVLSEINYPGWIAFVDGKHTRIEPAYEVLRSVDLSEGVHVVKFQFLPIDLIISLCISAATIGLIIFGVKRKANDNR